jgi:hypothetical protein
VANQHRPQPIAETAVIATIADRATIVDRVTTTIRVTKGRTIATVNLVDNPVARAMIVMIATVLKAKDVIVVVAVVARADAMKALRAKIAKVRPSVHGTATAATLRKVENSFRKKQ